MFNYLGISFHISQFIQANTSALVSFSVSIDRFKKYYCLKMDIRVLISQKLSDTVVGYITYDGTKRVREGLPCHLNAGCLRLLVQKQTFFLLPDGFS